MNSYNKIFFVFLAVALAIVGSGFGKTGNGKENGEVSSFYEKFSYGLEQKPVAEAKPAVITDNSETGETKIDASYGEQSGKGNYGNIFENGALLKPDLLSFIDAFQKVGGEQAPQISGNFAAVADLKTGRNYFEENDAFRWPVSSIAELMAAVVAAKKNDPALKITFPSGETYSLGDAVAAMLMGSKAGAAEAIANAYGKSDFVAEMNATAKEFGMYSTNFSDPAGLSAGTQSTVLDLEKLAFNIYLNYPKIFETTKKKSVYVTELNSKKIKLLSNANSFAGTSGFVGGKAGSADDGGANILSIFSYRGRPVLVIILGSSDGFGETEKLMDWFGNNYK